MINRTGFVLILLALQVSCGAAEFDDLAGKLPDGANTILLIDVDRVLETDLAGKNGWGKPNATVERPIYLPPEASQVMVGALVDPARQFTQSWEAAVANLKESLPMRLIAKAEGGYAETINGKEAAWAPSDAYFIQLNDDTLGLFHPANKQAASRWIDQQEQAGSRLSAYLQSAVDKVADGPQIVLALDAKDSVPAHRVHQRMADSRMVAKHKMDVDQIAGFLASLHGITLEITITDKAQAKAQVDFGGTVPFDEQVARDLVLGALTNLQAEIPGVDSWNFSIAENSIVAEGELALPGLRRILSMLEIPSTKFSSLKGEDTESEGSADEIAEKSLAYFKTISGLIDDLQRQAKSARGDNYWFDRYARRIERMPILHVDSDLLDFGQKTAETLRVMSGNRKTANLSAGVSRTDIAASSGSYSNYNHNYGGYGYRRNNARDQQKSQNAANRRYQASASSAKVEGFRLINNATFDIRRTMTERYSIEF